MRRATTGLEELKRHLDTTIVVPNQNLFKIANESTGFEESFSLSNDVLKHGVQSITDLMVRPGMINLDFADVETVMSSSGKAMMGTGEAEGENRAMAATELALNNPLIDEYTLQGAKGLLVNITGGSDIKLFEVDAAVNKIRAEVDPEAELIFGAIKDENMNSKIRVSIVATSLKGSSISDTRPVLNVVNGSNGNKNIFPENLFSKSNVEQNVINSIDGATALKLDERYEIKNSEEQSALIDSFESKEENVIQEEASLRQEKTEEIPRGVSIESASYIENNGNTIDDSISNENEIVQSNTPQESIPKLFSEEHEQDDHKSKDHEENNLTDQLFDQDSNAEEDFEIPAFLRRQKF